MNHTPRPSSQALSRPSPHPLRRWLAAAAWTGLVALAIAPAHAALGQGATALQAAPTQAVAPTARLFQAKTVAQASWTLRQTVLDTGTTVQELVRGDGVVFAVAWSGPVLPDVDTLLGSYRSDFDAHLQQRRAQNLRGGSVAFAGPRLVLHSGGRMRDFHGHAYAPALVPAGVAMQKLLP